MAPRAAKISKRAGPTCAANVDTWWNNDQGETPCDVYQSIMDKCGYTAPAIAGNDAYYPVIQAQDCMCNTVAYNLGSACQDCQRGTTDQGIIFALYTTSVDGCPTTSTSLPESATPADDIPQWAFLDTSEQFWSYIAAKEVALNGDTTATDSSQPTSTSASSATMSPTPTLTPTETPTETPTTSTSAVPVSSSHKSTNAGAIGGGVGGGVVALLVIIGLLLFWRRRRARKSLDEVPMGAVGGSGDESRNPSASSESSLTESGKAVGATSHYTPHSQMAQLHHQGGSGIIIPSYSTTSALVTPVDAPLVPAIPREYATPTPARSLATSPTPSVPTAPITNKVKRVPVRYSEDELARAEQAEQGTRRSASQE